MSELRRFQIRGETTLGTEHARDGRAISLLCTVPHWPFPQWRTLDRGQLVRVDGGPAEPAMPRRRKVKAAA